MNLQDIIDQHLAQQQVLNENRERSGRYSPSKFGRCFRMQYWSRANEKETNPPDQRSLRLFSSGKIMHDWVENIFLNKSDTSVKITQEGVKILPTVEQKIETEHFCGFADIVTEDEVIDMKTEHSYAKDYRKVEGYSIIEDKKPNVLQIGWYAIQLNKPFFRICYIDRDNLLIDEYKIPVTDTIKEMVSRETDELISYWLTNTLPKAEPRVYGIDKKTKKPKECFSYCGFRDKCIAHENEQGRKHPVE